MRKNHRIYLCLLLLMIGGFVMPILARADCELPVTTHAENIDELTGLLPGDVRGVLAIDMNDLLSGSSAAEVICLLNCNGSDAALNELFGAINHLAANVDLAGVMKTVLLVQTTDNSEGLFLLSRVSCDTISEVIKGPDLMSDGSYGAGAHAIYLDLNGNSLCLLKGGIVIAGKLKAVQSVLDVFDGVSAANVSDIFPFLSVLQSGSPFSFVYGLPAMFNSAISADRSLKGAALVSGSLDFSGATISGSVSFHTSNAEAFVENYNKLDSKSGETPLVLKTAIANDLSRVVLSIPSTPINKSAENLINSRNTLKKLFYNMQAFDYAEDVQDPGNMPWLDLIVSSEADNEGSPGSVFIRWEFKDQAAIDAFEKDELPEGFTLAPTQFMESDVPGYFIVLNLYNSAGSIVNGARAEWDIFVQPPDGDAYPRFMVIEALAEAISADSVNGLTPPEPLSHQFVGNTVVSRVGKLKDGVETPVFTSIFPRPSLTTDNVARFTREMAAGNDYIYWGNGVLDRAFYNATTFNYDAVFVDLNRVIITDNSRWKKYLKETPTYVVYYLNTLEYVVSPWYNLDSPYLDLTSEWLNDLYDFKNAGNYLTLMRGAVRDSFMGTGDVLIKNDIMNTIPAAYYNFKIIDPESLSTMLKLPAGYSLAPTRFLKNDTTEDYYLTLSVYEIEGAVEGTRAEWSVYVDDGNGREKLMIIDLQTEEAAVDPVSLMNLPGRVSHELAGSTLTTRLSSSSIYFDASFDLTGSAEETLSLDWIEAGDHVCHLNGICDKRYYDGETLSAPIHVPATVNINTISTPWNSFINTTPDLVFYRSNAQEYAVKPWHNLKVVVEDADSPEIDKGSHIITGTGTLTGETNAALDSNYTYIGAATLFGNNLAFTIDQEIQNALGESHIMTAGSFNLTTGLGTSTVMSCIGPLLVCAGVDPVIGTPDATSEYIASNLNSSDTECITWGVIFDLSVAGFGEAESISSLSAVLASNCTDSDEDGYSIEGGCCGKIDCDDSDPNIYPNAGEKCSDAKDNDCDGSINEGCGCLAERLFAQGDSRLQIMRRFRDEILYSSSFGLGMVDLYYKKSDELVTLIEDSPAAHMFFKRLFEKLIPVMKIMLHASE